MAYDSVRAQLDKLLGPDRNGPLNPSTVKKTPHYTDDSVCKHYLLGFCPNDLHIKHRSEPGSCRLDHSDAAKAAFEKDEAAGKLRRERVRWTRDLLRECRSILYEEDRKIRGHARRLQETYNATGDLAGLMIRDFDTLKKLGMVSKQAKILVLSEMDGFDEFDDSQSNHDEQKSSEEPQKKTDQKPSNTKQTSDNSPDDDLDGFGIVKVIPATNDTGSADKESKNPRRSSETKSESDKDDVDEFGRIRLKAADKSDKPKDEDKKVSGISANGDGDGDGVDDDDDGFGLIKVIPAEARKDDDSEKDSNDNSKSEKKILKKGEEDSYVKKDEDKPKTHSSKSSGTEDAEESGKNDKNRVSQKQDSGEAETLVDESKEGDSEQSLTPEQLMDKFYEAGVGPDGLLMLDKKKSLRVCACCGGYISLVDAESRLLSHYGGKSHHSLAQLRAKVPELDEFLANAPASIDDERPRSGPRPYRSERDSDRPWRGDDDRHRGSGRQERFAGRSRREPMEDRGHGTTNWYNSSGKSDDMHRGDDDRYRGDDRNRGDDRYRSDERYNRYRNEDRPQYDDRNRDERYPIDDRHRGDDRYYRDERYRGEDRFRENRYRGEDRSRDRQGGRYDSGRKRHRSPSPHRSSRRSRRYN